MRGNVGDVKQTHVCVSPLQGSRVVDSPVQHVSQGMQWLHERARSGRGAIEEGAAKAKEALFAEPNLGIQVRNKDGAGSVQARSPGTPASTRKRDGHLQRARCVVAPVNHPPTHTVEQKC